MTRSIDTAEELKDPGRIFTDPAAFADPDRWYAAAKRIRETNPVLRVERDGFPHFWALTTHADVHEVERQPDVFTNAPLPVMSARAGSPDAAEPGVKTLIQMDGDEHRAHRAIVNDWFKPGSIKRLQGRVDELAAQAVDHMAELGGECDFVNDVALHFPLQVILSLLGLPEDDYGRMLKLTQEMFGAEDPDIARVSEDDAMLEVITDFFRYFTTLAADRRAQPTEDLASVIANARIDDRLLADLVMVGHFLIIATAGHDTTSNAIAGGLVALMQHPDQLALLQKEPKLIDHAADELIRYVSPVKHFCRTVREERTVGGVTFQPGDLVYLSYASANRDEKVFADAERLDVRRENAASHLGFGFGRHFCLGAHLARMEIRSLFRALLARLDHIEPDGDASWIKAIFVQGPKRVPIGYQLR
jgi:cytochrome P450